jgi:hypothetical protein
MGRDSPAAWTSRCIELCRVLGRVAHNLDLELGSALANSPQQANQGSEPAIASGRQDEYMNGRTGEDSKTVANADEARMIPSPFVESWNACAL